MYVIAHAARTGAKRMILFAYKVSYHDTDEVKA